MSNHTDIWATLKRIDGLQTALNAEHNELKRLISNITLPQPDEHKHVCPDCFLKLPTERRLLEHRRVVHELEPAST